MALLKLAGLAGLCSLCALSQTTFQVGAGSTADVQTAFMTAYQRNGFSTLVGAPLENVTPFLSTGLIQTFPGAADKTQTFALIKPDATSPMNVVQVLAGMFSYYGYIGYSAAGFPTTDTAACPTLISPSVAGSSCYWQSFSGDFALFIYPSLAPDGAQFFIADPFYTPWNNLGGISVIGPATAVLTQTHSRYGSSAINQPFDRGTMDSLNGGPYTGLFTVRPPIYSIYAANGAEAGVMGFPVSAEILVANGVRQQAFERGAISYNTGTLVATLLPPVASVTISAGASLQMLPGGTSQVQASLADASGAAANGRPVIWSSSNPQVVQIRGGGTSVVLNAVSAGTAVVTAMAEGQTSAPLNVTVSSSYCCAVGQGAPTTAIQQAFQDAVSRNGLNIVLPAASGVTRVGAGYVQQLTGASGAAYLVAVPDSISAGYLVMGTMLAQYLQLGGPSGVLGYPLSDATVGGRQVFQGGDLAGNPVQLVTGSILSGWRSLGYETGSAGSPTGTLVGFVTFRGTTGVRQNFQNGQMLATTAGSLAGQAFFVSGLVLATYTAGGGVAGSLGAPITAERPVNGQNRQDFEGGYIAYTLGASQAIEVDTPRQPVVTAAPSQVRAGTSVHLVIGGFNNGATIRVSQTGQADFMVTASGGTYAWDEWVSSTSTAGTVTVKAADMNSSASAQASYSVYTTSVSALTISMVSGDRQNGAPGAKLPQPLVVMVEDQTGNPVAGQAVSFAASPGAQVQPTSAMTDAAGMASATLRMPSGGGVALATSAAATHVVTFSANSAAFSLTNFPALTQAVSGTLGNGSDTIRNKGALLTAAASILRYHQSRGELPQPFGLADPSTLNQFLTQFCTSDSQGNKVCDGFSTLGASPEQTVNLWRLGAFVSNSLTVVIEPFDQNSIRDLTASGAPMLLALSLGGLGSHFVVASGIAADGSIAIADPNPAFAQTNLNGYLNGFTASGQKVQGTLTGAVRLVPQAPALPGFVVTSNAAVVLTPAAGSCGNTLTFPGIAAVAGTTPPGPPGALYFAACDGSSLLYELDIGVPHDATFTDLSSGGARIGLSSASATSSEISQSNQHWSIAPLATLIMGVLNPASYTNQMAPGGLVSIFGAGLTGPGTTTVQIGGQNARVIASTPFQLNAQIPVTAAPGMAQLTVTSSNGTAQQQVAIANTAPAIFSLSTLQAAITNSDNSLNSPFNPAKRGSAVVIYATGLGTTSSAGIATTPVTVMIGGTALSAAYAGLSPGTPGLNQVNVTLPATMPPGLAIPLYLMQGGVASNTVTVAVQ